MIRYLPVVIQLALLVYCLIDCIQADSARVRNLPKPAWVLLIVVLPLVGSVAWLVAGRPQGAGASSAPWPATQTSGFPEYERPRPPRGPDDDPDFLADLRASDAEHEAMLAEWEAKLRERERELRAQGSQQTDDEATRPEEPPEGDPPGTRPR